MIVVLVKSDERVRRGKGPLRPIIPEEDRVRMVSAIKGVDYAFIGPHYEFTKDFLPAKDQMYARVIKALKPDIFYSTNPTWGALAELKLTRVVIGKRPQDMRLRSTTDIINRIVETHA